MSKPLAVDLFCGLGGWAEGFLAEGYDVIGFDIERRPYPGQLVLQDALTIHGSQFRDVTAIVASPPCQAYSYMAMPWKRGKAIAAEIRADESGARLRELNALFDACFRIQREASEAAGRDIPMVVENVAGAQRWVGRAAWHFGSFYLWGDVPALMPFAGSRQKRNPDGTNHGQGSWFAIADSKNRGSGRKNDGGSWFNVANNTTSGHGQNPDGRKVSINFYEHEKGARHTRHLTNQRESDAIKQHGSGPEWFDNGIAALSSKSTSRKQASAEIAKIPFALAQHIAATFKPCVTNGAQ